MVYVALLRGINVGGNNKVAMVQLKALFEGLGFTHVKTYINSGNVIFSAKQQDESKLADSIELAIENKFGFKVFVVVKSLPVIQAIAQALPDDWQNNADMKCDVMFLWQSVDSPNIVEQLTIKPELDDVIYVPGAILWRVDRKNVTRSGLMKLASAPLYKQMTIRNCNTLRKLVTLMNETEAL